MPAEVNEECCTGCNACVEVCPVEAIEMVDGKAHVDGDKCIECGVCVGTCPDECITM